MAKIGLISYHFARNYGTVLQAYALQKVLRDLGCEAEYIDYSWEWLSKTRGTPITLARKVKSIAARIIRWRERMLIGLAEEKFHRFADSHLHVNQNQYTAAMLLNTPPRYDKYIVGSDQTWNPLLLDSTGIKPFLLAFVDDPSKKYAYAPSLGTASIPPKLQSMYANELSSFRMISCREQRGCDIIADLIGRKVKHVVDPTLLLTSEQWAKISHRNNINEPYILCYILGNKKCISAFAENLGRIHKIPVYYVMTSGYYIWKKRKLVGVGPLEFIDLIHRAAFVVTDSYHGTIFSVNFQKQFYSFAKRRGGIDSEDNSRISDFLSDYGLTSRFRDDDDVNLSSDIDYSMVGAVLAEKRRDSLEFIKCIVADEDD